MKKVLIVLLLLALPSIGSAQAWPKKGENFIRGCEKLHNVLGPLFAGAAKEAQKNGEMYNVTAKVCIGGTMHVRTSFMFKEKQTLVEAELYTTFRFLGKKDKDGKPIVEVKLIEMRVVNVSDFPTENATKDPTEGSERF